MDLEQRAIARIKFASEMSQDYYGQPLICAYSGGKDSDVMLELFRRSGVEFEVHNQHTTVDAPPTVYHIRSRFRELELAGIKAVIDMPVYQDKRIDMWNLIPIKRMPPTRMVRYCCSVLKEQGGRNRFVATGVRWDESNARAEREAYESFSASKKNKIAISDEIMLLNDNSEKRRMTEHCLKQNKMMVNPIIDWTHRDVWDFIRNYHVPFNPLYDCGYRRVGCVGCPMAGRSRWKEFSDFPTYRMAYTRAFEKMLFILRKDWNGESLRWKSGEDVFLWWMQDENVDGQIEMQFEGTDLIGFNER